MQLIHYIMISSPNEYICSFDGKIYSDLFINFKKQGWKRDTHGMIFGQQTFDQICNQVQDSNEIRKVIELFFEDFL